MDAVPQKGEESKEVNVGKIHEIGLSALPEGESQALSQRGEMLYGEVRHRPEELSSWTARPGPEKILGFTVFWKTSSSTPSKRRTDKKGLQENSSFLFWNGDWTTQSIAWVLLIREMKHANL
jgi:hypothetical protein